MKKKNAKKSVKKSVKKRPIATPKKQKKAPTLEQLLKYKKSREKY